LTLLSIGLYTLWTCITNMAILHSKSNSSRDFPSDGRANGQAAGSSALGSRSPKWLGRALALVIGSGRGGSKGYHESHYHANGKVARDKQASTECLLHTIHSWYVHIHFTSHPTISGVANLRLRRGAPSLFPIITPLSD
jgi:hypothetical protein